MLESIKRISVFCLLFFVTIEAQWWIPEAPRPTPSHGIGSPTQTPRPTPNRTHGIGLPVQAPKPAPASAPSYGIRSPAQAPRPALASAPSYGIGSPVQAPSHGISSPPAGLAPKPAVSPSGPALAPSPTAKIFDVTDYGAIADGETNNHLTFLSAWDEACKHRDDNVIYLIPQGTFFLGPITFKGPCYHTNTLQIQISGTLQAPEDLDEFPNHRFWIMLRNLSNFILTGGGTGLLDGQGEVAWDNKRSHSHHKEYPHSLRFQQITSATICDITLLNSKNFHMSITDSSNILVHGINITAPGDSPNTDGIHLQDSTNITITSLKIGTGDDCISIGPGNTNINISDITCGPGHGISVGSLGKSSGEKEVIGVTVKNCTINGTDNGVRIKTWPREHKGKASNMTFEDIKMINASNPIVIDQQYCARDHCKLEDSLVAVCNIHFKNITGTSHSETVLSLLCSEKVPCKGIVLKDINITHVSGGPAIAVCSNVEEMPKECVGTPQDSFDNLYNLPFGTPQDSFDNLYNLP